MSRPTKSRWVAFIPDVTFFKPAGIPLRDLEEIRLTVEEAEAIRLKDLEGLEQEEGAENMNISRPTFQRMLASARQKIADALLNGKAIRIEGGNFEMLHRRFRCPNNHEWEATPKTAAETTPQYCPFCKASDVEPVVPASRRHLTTSEAGPKPMKIAAISENGTTVSRHFGRAPYYVVVTVEDGKAVSKEKRDKAGHHTFAASQHPDTALGEQHAGAQARHTTMTQSIDDCKVLIAGGMGWGAYENLKSRGIETVVTDVESIDEAVKLYLEGKLPNLMERVH